MDLEQFGLRMLWEDLSAPKISCSPSILRFMLKDLECDSGSDYRHGPAVLRVNGAGQRKLFFLPQIDSRLNY